MGRRGPAKTPTKILRARGSWRAVARKNEPKPAGGVLRCPAWLRPEAKRAWKRIIPRLKSMGVIGDVDAHALERYCQLYAKWRECEKWLVDNGSCYPETDAQGHMVGVKEYPQVGTALRFGDQLLKLEQQFGLTPSARASLAVPDKPAKSAQGKGRFFTPREAAG